MTLQEHQGDGSGSTVLVVDDDAALTRLLRLILRDGGFHVRTAMNGRQALDEVTTDEPDVIILDLQMPVMDGRTFIREMHARGLHPRVLVLSATGARRAQRELHADAAMEKPFEPEDLVETVAQLTRRN
jgi:DNA-binding response OmpR family regulator